MSDAALSWLQSAITEVHTNDTKGIFCIDENVSDDWSNLAPRTNLQIISNRWDIAQQALKLGWNASFSDIDFAAEPDMSIDVIFYRVSKEKALVNHLFNEAWRCLKPNGHLYLAGLKNEGTKTYIDKFAALLGCDKSIEKNGLAYGAKLTKTKAYDAALCLDDSNYSQLRAIGQPAIQQHAKAWEIFSKPGQFGWNKFDKGSELLIEHLPNFIANQSNYAPEHGLDLGCGYGYLTLCASRLDACNSIKRWTLTDNNAAAILSAQHNVERLALNARVFADNCAANITTKADLILCNPPFHQGFSVEDQLTDKFLKAAQGLLAPKGQALFVVNQFIPLERKAAQHFKRVETITNNGSFKLVGLSQ